MYRRQGSRTSPLKKCKMTNWLSEKALQRAEKLKAKEKRKDKPI